MSYFSRLYKKENLISRSLDIDEELYEELEKLSKKVYEASISKLVNASIEKIIETENIQLYERKNKSYVSRSFLIRESLLEGLYTLKSIYKLLDNKKGLAICQVLFIQLEYQFLICL